MGQAPPPQEGKALGQRSLFSKRRILDVCGRECRIGQTTVAADYTLHEGTRALKPIRPEAAQLLARAYQANNRLPSRSATWAPPTGRAGSRACTSKQMGEHGHMDLMTNQKDAQAARTGQL